MEKKIVYLLTETDSDFENGVSIIKKYDLDELEKAKQDFEKLKDEYSELYLHRVRRTTIPHYFNPDLQADKLIESMEENAEISEDFGLCQSSKQLIKETFVKLKNGLLFIEQENFIYHHLETVESFIFEEDEEDL